MIGKRNGADQTEDNKKGNIVRFPFRSRPGREPIFNLPPFTKSLVLLILVIHTIVAFTLSDTLRYDVYTQLGFVPGAWTGHDSFTWLTIFSPVTYMLLHGSWGHVLINTVMIMAFASGVERVVGGRRMIAFFILCGIASVIVQFVLSPASADPVIGASGGISGLFAAVLIMMQASGGTSGRQGLLPFILIWIVVSALFGFTGAPGGGNVAWAAHIGGFLAGFLLAPRILKIRI